MRSALMLFLAILAASVFMGARTTAIDIAKCSLYEGAYTAEKKPVQEFHVRMDEFLMPQYNLDFTNDGQRYLYWVGLTYKPLNDGEERRVFRIHLMGVLRQDDEADVDYVVGQPLEIIYEDTESNSSLRCYNPTAPDTTIRSS